MGEGDLPSVLIVDDDRVSRTLLAELLQGDCRILLAKDGASALQRVQEETNLHLLLLDVSMPDMSGYEVLRRLRAEERTADIGVIFISALTDEADEEYGLLLGASDYVFKPIRPAIALARIRTHLRLAAQRKELERLSERDALTGIANRRYFDRALELEFRRAARTGEPFGLAMVDIDYFKQYNDRYGHGAGDEALRKVAQTLALVAQRPYDVVARYGGEEFVLLLPAVEHLDELLERLRRDVEVLELRPAEPNAPVSVTVSCGGMLVQPALKNSPAALLQQVDELLYRAKHEGRNRVVLEGGSSLRRRS